MIQFGLMIQGCGELTAAAADGDFDFLGRRIGLAASFDDRTDERGLTHFDAGGDKALGATG